jgi:hypothetical protein
MYVIRILFQQFIFIIAETSTLEGSSGRIKKWVYEDNGSFMHCVVVE